MRIKLTYAEGRALLVAMPEEVSDRLLAERRHCWNKSHLYELPPVAWREVRDYMRRIGFGQRGGRKHSESFYSALAQIVEDTVSFELHPAFHGRAVIGLATDLIPAFIAEDGTLSPYPPGEFVVLHPQHIVRHGKNLTIWRPDDWASSEDPSHRREFHRGLGVFDL